MSRILFTEQQKFPQIWLFVFIGVSNLTVFIPLMYGFYQQIINGQPWGQSPMSDTGLIVLILVITAGIALINFIIFSARLETQIKDNSVYYKYFPFVWNWKLIYKDRITSFQIRTFRPVIEFGGYGYRKRPFKKMTALIMSGNNGLQLDLNDGRKLVIGTQKPNELGEAMQKLMNKETAY